MPQLKKNSTLTYISYGWCGAGLITTFGGICGIEGNVGNHAAQSRNTNILLAGFSLGILPGLSVQCWARIMRSGTETGSG